MISLVAAVTETTSHVVSCKKLRYLNVSCCIDAEQVLTRADGFEFWILNSNFEIWTHELQTSADAFEFWNLNSLTLSIYLRYEYGTLYETPYF
jgi:hypothetical protein